MDLFEYSKNNINKSELELAPDLSADPSCAEPSGFSESTPAWSAANNQSPRASQELPPKKPDCSQELASQELSRKSSSILANEFSVLEVQKATGLPAFQSQSAEASLPSLNLTWGLEPLAARMRPKRLEDLVGQQHLLRPGTIWYKAIQSGQVPSLILFGPPGAGKSSLIEIIIQTTRAHVERVSATEFTAKVLREVAAAAKTRKIERRQRTLFFIDEIHRLTSTQQDLLLPHTESGDMILLGATTENPSFNIARALRSRCQILELKSLNSSDHLILLNRAARLLGIELEMLLGKEAIELLISGSGGDARTLLNRFELIYNAFILSPDDQSSAMVNSGEAPTNELDTRSRFPLDSAGLQVFAFENVKPNLDSQAMRSNLMSALIKSMRASDPDDASFYLRSLVHAKESLGHICRRLVIFASEDIGLADSTALSFALAARDAVEYVGDPEAQLILSHAVISLAKRPKSREAVDAIEKSTARLSTGTSLSIPAKYRLHSRGQ